MKQHVKIYLDFFDYTIADIILCENCGQKAVDIHHLQFKSQLGKDVIENLMALCRHCHDNAHSNKIINEKFKLVHKCKLEMLK